MRDVRMLLLTGQRKGEVAGMRWAEINVGKKLWTIPPERFKSDATHLVPLSEYALSLLAELPRVDGCDLLFTTKGRSPVNGFSKSKARLDAATEKELLVPVSHLSAKSRH